MPHIIIGPDGQSRCDWCASTPELLSYHDQEWGFPIGDDRRLFEKICLECFQAGLSWRTILNKRENFRRAFANFDVNRIVDFTSGDVERLMDNPKIVRNRRKIEAVINNAARAQELISEAGSLAAFIWQYEPKTSVAPQTATTCAESVALSKALKKRGWQFVGPTTMFAFMQSMGLINDHLYGCGWRDKVEQARIEFVRPCAD